MGQFDVWLKIATLVISFIGIVVTALFGVAIALLNHFLKKEADALIQRLKTEADAMARSEERTYALRASQVTPFLEKLHDSIYLSKEVVVSAEGTADLPFPTDVLKALLLSNPSLGKLFELNVDLPPRRTSVLVGIAGTHINDFTSKANVVLDKSLRLYNEIVNCDLSHASVATLKSTQKQYAALAGDLLVVLLKFLREPINVKEPWPEITAKNLGNWITDVVAAKTSATNPTPNPYWRALWTVPHAQKEFDEAFDHLAEALGTEIDGALNVMIEHKASLKTGGLGYVVVIEFSAKDRLEAFLLTLPNIKMQSKPLWIGATAANEINFA